MGFIFVILAVLGENSSNVIDRLNFKRNKVDPRQLMVLVFFGMSASMVGLILFTRVPSPNLTLMALGLMTLIALVSFGGNFFDYRSLKADDLSLREPLADFLPIAAGLVGYILFPAERRPGFLLALLIGMAIVYWGTHRRKLRKFQSKGMHFLLLAICLYALLPSIYKLTLDYVSPAYITLFRVVAILILSGLFLPNKKLGRLTSKQLGYGLLSGVVCSLGVVAELNAITRLGVVTTSLFMLLGPAIRYSAAYFILREKVRKGEITSSGLLVLVVLASVLGWL